MWWSQIEKITAKFLEPISENSTFEKCNQLSFSSLLSPELFLIGVVHEHPEVYIIITSIHTYTSSFLLGLQYTFSSVISGRYLESQLNEVSDNARVNEYIAQSQSISASSHPAIFTQLLIAVQENCKI